jgi:hypothetical protein
LLTGAVSGEGLEDRIKELHSSSHGGDGGNLAHKDEVRRTNFIAVAVDRDEGRSGIALAGISVVLSVATLGHDVDQRVRIRWARVGAGRAVVSGVAAHRIFGEAEGTRAVGACGCR